MCTALPSTVAVIALAWSLVLSSLETTEALKICIAGGTGKFGAVLATKLKNHDVTILARNAFLAVTPNRVSSDFGWLGESYMSKNPHVRMRDWDGGDLLDIVGQDWMGWQEDALKPADAVVNLVGGYTQQRVMATERIVRESIRDNPTALQIMVSPKNEEELNLVSKGFFKLKMGRVDTCEDMVTQNCLNHDCLRMDANNYDKNCDEIVRLIESKCS
jgi:hypothetical protein